MPDAESVADFFSSRATDCTQLIVCFHHTPLPLASVVGMLYADWHLSRQAKCVQMLSKCSPLAAPCMGGLYKFLFLKGLWPNRLLFTAE